MSARRPGRGTAESPPATDDDVSERSHEGTPEPSGTERVPDERAWSYGFDPFVSFTEWSGPADEADCADF